MEAGAGAQILPPPARKRDLCWTSPFASTKHGPDWDPASWSWDSTSFAARPAGGARAPCLRAEGLTLKLGGTEGPVSRPAKRVRSGSPSSTAPASFPMCQVDDCRADLSGAKDYHRRHKVCEVHSKTTEALVSHQMQRFCQQCSRFHLLSEFDDGKRSCRRRLAGHNRRRRKTQPEDAAPQLLVPGDREGMINGGLDILNLLSILAGFQGNGSEKTTGIDSALEKDRLLNVINKINSMPSATSEPRSQAVSEKFDLNMPQTMPDPMGMTVRNGTASSFPTMNLLGALSSALKSSKPEKSTSQSQGSSGCTTDAKENLNHLEPANGVISFVLVSSMIASEPCVSDVRSTLPLQLFNSNDGDSPPKVASVSKYLSSQSSNPTEGRSPSSSPPIVRKFFPVHSEAEKNDHMEDAAMAEVSTSQQWSSSLELIKTSERGVYKGTTQNMPYRVGYTSSASDHSPSSSNSDSHDRTGRIMFKLFDKSPSDLPGNLRAQISNWLSHIPSEMESHIRPGCVVLSLYLSMPHAAWSELKKNLSHRVNLLIQSDGSRFWSNGRFLVCIDQQLASHKDGRIRHCKSWKTWSSPELLSVSPLAVVSGKETPILLHGRNLTVPGTKVHCTYLGGYRSKENLGSVYEGTVYDDSSLECFNFPGGPPDAFGRCFIEVENGFKGNSFPLIIANESICQELMALESELEDVHGKDTALDDHVQGRNLKSRDDILHFLNELGWLFQRSNPFSKPNVQDFSGARFKFLLTFAVERDWSVLTAKLLDMLAERCTRNVDLAQESMEFLSDIQLLGRAVKRKCKTMVNLLLNYSVSIGVDSSKIYIFPPNLAGPGGLTSLHLAASCEGCEDMVDALTNDPQEIGLNSWNSCIDDNGQSPFDYAAMANNYSYNEIVRMKLSDRENHQISLNVEEGNILDKPWIVRQPNQANFQRQPGCLSCAHCAAIEYRRSGGTIHSQGLLRRPYIHSIVAIAAVCVCVCLFLRGAPQLGTVAPFKWENVDYGPR